MKPKLKYKVIRVPYWDCGNPKHSHGSEEVAARCAGRTKQFRWAIEEKREMALAWYAGETFASIARRKGRTGQTIASIIRALERRARREKGRDLSRDEMIATIKELA